MLAAPQGMRRVFLDAGPALAPLLARLTHLAPDFLASLQVRADETVTASPALCQPIEPLTEREVELLRLLNDGLQNKEIAESMSITVGTTKQYVNRLFGKLGVRNRVEAVSVGRRLHMLA